MPIPLYQFAVCARCWGTRKGVRQKVRYNAFAETHAGAVPLHPKKLLCRDCYSREMFARKRADLPTLRWSASSPLQEDHPKIS